MLGLGIKQIVHDCAPCEAALVLSVKVNEIVLHCSLSLVSQDILPIIENVSRKEVLLLFSSNIH